MAKKASKGEFTPLNTAKYIGKYPIIYRSSWEFTMMRMFDEHPNVVAWASETIQVPYKNPLTGKWSMYVPDFLVVYADKDGRKHAEVLEVKPLKERPDIIHEGRISERTKLTQMVNAAKWQAAVEFCAKNNLKFRVASEDQMFGKGKRKR